MCWRVVKQKSIQNQTGLLSYRDKLETWNFGYSKHRYYTIQAANNKGADQTARMRRLICTFVVRIWLKQVFSWCCSYGTRGIFRQKVTSLAILSGWACVFVKRITKRTTLMTFFLCHGCTLFSSHRYGFEPSWGHVRQAKFCLQVIRRFFLGISRFSPLLSPNNWLGSKWVK